MLKPIVTKTLGPLHLEDLEPHRFEDMVRQLLYDFKPWRNIESTGRSGADKGFDARAWEMLPVDPANERSAEEAGEETNEADQDRIWLIQCKREKRIGPTKVVGYLDDIPAAEREGIYGVVLAAACDFSLAARERFRRRAREHGFSEVYLWGRGEIEDMLFQPKNDHLLFAYFGVSLQSRRRSLKTAVRAKLASKRKAENALNPNMYVLVRDASDERYPFLDDDKSKGRFERGRWTLMDFKGFRCDGLHLIAKRHYALVDDKDRTWDFAETVNLAIPEHIYGEGSIWLDRPPEERQSERELVVEMWQSIPEKSQAMFEVHVVIPYEGVLDIDKNGDDFFDDPHIYTVSTDVPEGKFWSRSSGVLYRARSDDHLEFDPSEDRRIVHFPRS